jgi:2-hydroxychromene-2-carboxylate isomerase
LYVRAKAPQRGGAFAERMFELVWKLADVAKPEAVDGVLTGIGVEPRAFRDFAAGDGPRQLAALQAELEALGLHTVPAYLIGGEPFLGRQHLPMVEWLLTGRAGLPPI